MEGAGSSVYTCHKGKVVVVLGFYIPPTAMVIRRRDLGLKSHPKDYKGKLKVNYFYHKFPTEDCLTFS